MMFERKLILVGFLFSMFLLGVPLQAEDPSPMFVDPKAEDGKSGEAINSGVVVAYGVRIKPPYTVELRGDTITINNIPFYPPRPDPELQPKGGDIPTEFKQEHGLIQDIFHEYRENIETMGKEAVRSYILNLFADNPLVESMEFFPDQDVLQLKFNSSRETTLQFGPDNYKPGDNKASQTLESQIAFLERAKKYLMENKMIIYGYKGGYHYLSPQNTQVFNQIIQNVKSNTISISEAESELRKFIGRTLVPGILSNLDSWDIN